MRQIKSFLQRGVLVIITAFLLTGVAVAGEVHEGYSTDKAAAVSAANKAAREAAKEKGTCWRPAKLNKCTKDADGYWTCYSESANHRGSCGGADYREP